MIGSGVQQESDSQWLFPSSALKNTPSQATLVKEMYDRARGVELLFRIGTSISLPSDAMFTAATWFHRFYMRFPMEDYHRQEIAAACIFLATKTDECGRKLKDVTRVYMAKVSRVDTKEIPMESNEVEDCQNMILRAEEMLLEALGFDFVVGIPHTVLTELFESMGLDAQVQDHAWSFAHDSYRTPLCILYSPQVIAAACIILAQKLVEGAQSPSLDHRVAWPDPSTTLLTPPSHQPSSPDASRSVLDHLGFGADGISSVAEALDILLEFYRAQDHQYLTVAEIAPPTCSPKHPHLFDPALQTHLAAPGEEQSIVATQDSSISTQGNLTPLSNEASTERNQC